MCDGIADELQGIDLGDIRLNKRSKQVIEAWLPTRRPVSTRVAKAGMKRLPRIGFSTMTRSGPSRYCSHIWTTPKHNLSGVTARWTCS